MELKPCPFCGAPGSTGLLHVCVVPVESFMLKETIEFYTVKCDCCGAKCGNCSTREFAAAALEYFGGGAG